MVAEFAAAAVGEEGRKGGREGGKRSGTEAHEDVKKRDRLCLENVKYRNSTHTTLEARDLRGYMTGSKPDPQQSYPST